MTVVSGGDKHGHPASADRVAHKDTRSNQAQSNGELDLMTCLI